MKNKDLEDRINHDIDALLDGHTHLGEDEPGEAQEILRIAQRLAQTDMSRQSRVQKSLRKRLLNRIPNLDPREAWSPEPQKGNRTMQPKIRPFVFTLVALFVLAFVFGITPPGQTFAQDLWDRVGPLIIVNRPVPTPEPAQTGATPTALPGAGGIPLPMPTPYAVDGNAQEVLAPNARVSPTPLPSSQDYEPIDNRIALEKYGFRVLQPGSLPKDYLLMTEHQVTRTQDGRLVSLYVYSTNSAAFDGAYLSIQQSTFQKNAPIEFMVGDAKVSKVDVRGTSATFIQGANQMTVQDKAGNNTTLPMDYLMWEENGNFFMMTATQLTQEEMVRVAASLQ